MTHFIKFWASIAGSLAGFLLAFAASNGLGTCTQVNLVDVCTVLGVDQATLALMLTGIGSSLAVLLSPKNKV